MKILNIILILIFCMYFGPATAQWYIGDDVGILSYDLRDEMLSYYRYEEITSSFLNIGIHYVGAEHRLTARYGKKVARLGLAEARNFYSSNSMYFQNHELDLEYFRKIFHPGSSFRIFFGGAYNGHFSYYEQSFESSFISGFHTSHEMAAVNFSVNGLMEYKVEEHLLQYKAGLSLYNYGSRPPGINSGSDFNLSGFGFSDYLHIQNSLVGFIRLSDRFMLKPEYRLRYYTYAKPDRLKVLKQSFLAGIYFRVW